MKSVIQVLALGAVPVVSAKTALLVIDVQDCFLEANTTSGQPGSLSVPASHIIPLINQMRAEKSCLFDEVIFSQDFHPANHISFASSHGLAAFAHLGGKGSLPLTCLRPSSGNTADASCCPTVFVNESAVDCATQLCPPSGWNYTVNNSDLITGNQACTTCASSPESCYQTHQEMWTDHCLQTGDATFPPSLDKRSDDFVVQKGLNQYVDAYSAFMDNTQSLKTALDSHLQDRGITALYVVGIATDVCVKATARDALFSGTGNYTVTVVSDATAAVLGDETNFNAAMDFMESEGATIVTTAQVLNMSCPNSPAMDVGSAPAANSLFVTAFLIGASLSHFW